MSGVLILSLSTVIVKFIGLAYKIPLMSVLGADGMGYFNTAYEIFAILCGVSTTGLPVAVSMLVSTARERGDIEAERGVLRTSSAILLTKGVAISGGLALLAEPVAVWLGNPQAYLSILAISPSLLFCCIAGAVRGYFQGRRIMTPTAVSQLAEAAGKLIFGVALAIVALRLGAPLHTCAAFAVLGVSLGSLLSACYLLIRKRISLRGDPCANGRAEGKSCVLDLLRLSLPITLCSALIGVTRLIDMALIMRRLQDIGVSAAGANRIYGAYTTLALPVFSLVPAFIPPITESLIPRLAAAVESGSEGEQAMAVGNAVRLTLLLGIPSSLGVTLYARQIISLLFSGAEDAIDIAEPMLRALGIAVAVSCLVITANVILQTYRRIALPIIALLVGAGVKAFSAYVLMGMPQLGAMGAPISTVISNATVLALDVAFIKRVCPRSIKMFSDLPKIVLSSVVSVGASYLLYSSVEHRVGMNGAFLAALLLAVALYLLLSVGLGAISSEDINSVMRKNKKQNKINKNEAKS